MEMNKVKVSIAGVTYALRTDETAEYTNTLASEINEKMQELQAANPFMWRKNSSLPPKLPAVRKTAAWWKRGI